MKCENSWKLQSLRELATINYGRSPAAILAEDGLYPVVGTGGSERLGNDYLHEGESIILGRKGTIDCVYFATGRFWTIDTAYYLTDFTESVPKWLYYFLQTIDLRQMNEATGVPSLSRDLLYKIEIQTPPKPEQTKIAEILSTVDRAIEQTEALIAKQQRLKTGLMQDLLTCGIDEHGNLRAEQTHKFKDSPLGRIPVEWEVQTTQAIAQKIWIGLVTTMTTNYVQEGVKLIRNQNIKENRIQTEGVINLSLSFANLFSNRKLRIGDVVTVHTGDVGTSAVITNQFDGAHGFATINTRVDSGIIDNKYLCWFFNSQQFKRQIASVITGDGRDNLNLKDFVDLIVPFPRAISEQRRIAAIIDSCEERTINETNYLSKLRQQKVGLMQDLLTGKKRVTTLLNDTEVPAS